MTSSIAALFQRVPRQWRDIAIICLVAHVAAFVAVGFQIAISRIFGLCFQYPAENYPKQFPWITFGIIAFVCLLSGWLITQRCPEAAGSGIPQLKLAFWKDFGESPTRIGWVKFLVGTLSIGGGLSLGREGPSVQLGGNAASTLASWLGVGKQQKRAAVAAGAAAGLAAAFNAPLAAVAFVLEEILEDLNSRFLGPVLLAAVIGAFVVHACIGPQPAFELPRIGEPTWRANLLMPIVAAVAALVGVGFQRASLGLRKFSKSLKVIPPLYHVLIGGLITWALGMAMYRHSFHLGVFGLGYDDLTLALQGGLEWKLAALLLVGKFVATSVCYGFGGCGGIFSPSLFFGGLGGVIMATGFAHVFGLNPSDQSLLAIGGMSACLGAVVQAPVTAVIIIFEMTHQFSIVPGLMIAGLVSQLIARSCSHANFYEEVLIQDGHQMAHVIPPRDLRSWQNLPISAVAHFDPICVRDLGEETVRKLFQDHPYQRFPIINDGKLSGILMRAETERAWEAGLAPVVQPAMTVAPGTTIRDSQRELIESGIGLVVITEPAKNRPLAVVTLHDLLRAQVSLAERDG